MDTALETPGDKITHPNTHAVGVPEGRERERGRKSIEETLAKNFPNLMKTLVFQSKISTNPKSDKHWTHHSQTANSSKRDSIHCMQGADSTFMAGCS